MIALQLSIGSNIENRIIFLKQACQLIEKHLGKITAYSKVYETPAWGFVSTPFYNACISVQTQKNTKEALAILQEIEKEIGRTPKKGKAYEARPIDLDIIYSSEGIFNYPHLTVPHPLLQERKFVLVPLLDIYHHKHPLLHQNTQELLNSCDDASEIKATELSLT